ncbi:protein PHYTOCHROME-DEPENDENT LATE-FLOWERING-like [Impatiens glandulifera]|uniref:protein PHYTOCHROME-DEPENDENT LATE-FLOWERING-like n=1 Tax=Impatiens glandulifera TaxID=253017 RepID=UPI001FB0DAAA|nr:protein PHYTOCHROME-DEPENDENT LATE-FLOWERING-like [Impatiens glandulifera]
MGISFKISKKGTRFCRKPGHAGDTAEDEVADSSIGIRVVANNEFTPTSVRKPEINAICGSGTVDVSEISECEVSFVFSLFPDCYAITKPSAHESGNQDIQKFVHSYDRTSEILSTAIECGQLPADILDDFLPLKYVEGTIVCEVRDYRKCTPEVRNMPRSSDRPIVHKVRLRMSLANVVKDVPLISDDTWTYGDLMEVESRILKVLQPQLCLDPTPKLDRLCGSPISKKLNLGLGNLRRKRLHQIQESIGKRACIDIVPETSNARENISTQNVGPITNIMASRIKNAVTDPSSQLPLTAQQSQQHIAVTNQRLMMMQDNNATYANNSSIASVHGKRDNQDRPISPLANLSKRIRVMPTNADAVPHQQIDSFQGITDQWKNSQLQQQSIARGMHYQGMRIAKEEPVEMERFDKSEAETNQMDIQQARIQQRILPQTAFMRSNFPQTPWNNLGQQPLEMNSNPRKDDQFPKRKLAQSSRVSVGGLPQSPLSSKSGEFSQYGAAATSSALAASQKDKSAVNSVPTSLTSSANDSLQRQHQAQMAARRRSNALPKTPVISGVGSPASVGSMSVPLKANSPPVGNTVLDEQVLERFSKIEIISARFQLNRKTNKGVENYHVRNPGKFPAEKIASFLSSDSNNENTGDETCTMPLSKSLVGGNMNVCKTRVLNFVQTEQILQGNGFSVVPRVRTRMIMSDKSNDGMIAMHYGDIDDNEYLAAEDHLPTLPTAHYADLLAAQLCTLMIKEGYIVEDHVQPKPPGRISHPASNQPNVSVEIQQFPDTVSGQLNNEALPKPNTYGGNSSSLGGPNGVANTRMLPPVNTQALQTSQRPQQPEQQSLQQHPSIQQQSPSQFQRSSMHSANVMSQMNVNSQLVNNNNNHMSNNKPSSIQLQLMQQQQPQPPLQRRMMSMSNNNMAGFGGLGNAVMGMGGGVGPRAMSSSPMGPISGMGQNPMNLGQASNINNAIRSGQLTQAQIMAAKIRLAQSRGNMLSGGGINGGVSSGARQMHHLPGAGSGFPMLGQALNRGNLNSMQQQQQQQQQRSAMGPPKMIPGMNNMYMNQQQLQQLQLQQQQQQQMQLQQQMQQQQQPFHQQQQMLSQETTSPLQAVVSSSSSQQQQAASPSAMGGTQQQAASPQQLSQIRSPMSPQLSSGVLSPASPQTLGGSAELQGVNKGNNVNNS